MVCLIKPQFEAGREKVGKNGVGREESVHKEVIEKIVTYADLVGFEVKGLEYSPIKGPEGNIEYLVFLEKKPEEEAILALQEKEAEDLLAKTIGEGNGLADTELWKKTISQLVTDSHGL